MKNGFIRIMVIFPIAVLMGCGSQPTPWPTPVPTQTPVATISSQTPVPTLTTSPTTSPNPSPTPTLVLTRTPTPSPTPKSTSLFQTPSPTTNLTLAPAVPILKSPPNSSLTSSRAPTLEWQSSAVNAFYGLQVATDQDFNNMIIDEKGLREVSYVVPPSTLGYYGTLYWRVAAGNIWGKSAWSPSWAFKVPWTPTPKPTTTLSDTVLQSMFGVHTTKAVGEQKVIVIIADFPDVKPTLSKQQIYNMVFVDFDNYLRDASYGQMWLTGNVAGPYILPNPISYYNYSVHNLEADRTVIRALATDAFSAADVDVNFSQYSHVMLVVQAAKISQFTGSSGCFIPGLLGRSETDSVVTKRGQIITSAAVFPEDSDLGNFAHDTIHMLGGVIEGNRVTPCLYDQDLQSTSALTSPLAEAKIHVGNWDPLSCHVYKAKLPPTGLVSWTKMRLGWIEPSKIATVSPGQTITITLDPLDSSISSTLVIKIPLTSDTFYLVENRQNVGFDQYAPSTGILISYADDGYKGECRLGQGPVQLMDANPNVSQLEGAAFDIGKKDKFIDTQNNLAIMLLGKVDLSYEIKITTADKADATSESCIFPTFPEGFQRTK